MCIVYVHCVATCVHCRGDLPAECDKKFLAIACKLDRYGMDFHMIQVSSPGRCNSISGPVFDPFPTSSFQDVSNVDLVVGVSSHGLTVFCGDNLHTALNHFPWYIVHVHMHEGVSDTSLGGYGNLLCTGCALQQSTSKGSSCC